jgi:hypothetical protein
MRGNPGKGTGVSGGPRSHSIAGSIATGASGAVRHRRGSPDFLEPGRLYRTRTGLSIAHHLTPEKNICHNQVGLKQKGKTLKSSPAWTSVISSFLPADFISHHTKIFYKIDS